MLKPVMEKLLIAITLVLMCMPITLSIGATAADYPVPVEPVAPPSFDVQEKPILPSMPAIIVAPPPAPAVPVLPDIPATPTLVPLPEIPVASDPPVLPVPPARMSEPVVASPTAPVDITEVSATVPVVPPVVSLSEEPVAAKVPEQQDIEIVPEIPPGFTGVPQTVSVEEALELAIAPGEEVAPDIEAPVEDSPVLAEQEVIEEIIMSSAEPVAPDTVSGTAPVVAAQPEASVNVVPMADAEITDMLGEDTVAAMVAQPDIPQELRPPGIPMVLPGRVTSMTKAVDEGLLLTDVPKAVQQKAPFRPPQLLPVPGPEPGVVYIAPFVSVMVPKEVSSRVFDQFVDELIREGEGLGLEFVIIKKGLKDSDPKWLASRKYVTGEIYAYVEDSGCCSTDMRAKARITYRRPQQETPAFGFEYPVSKFFEHDRSSVDVERIMLADDIAATLAGELVRALQN